jgi:hypothetical protein
MEKIYKINKNNIRKSGFLPVSLPNAMPLVSKFFEEMSKKRQRCAVVNLENNFSISAMFTDVSCNCKQQLSQTRPTGFKHKPYRERLNILQLPELEVRYDRADMIQIYRV